jgi:hypothetical protein
MVIERINVEAMCFNVFYIYIVDKFFVDVV